MKRLIPLLMAACALPALCLADLHDPNNAADYMIVTTQELIDDYPWINQLADWRGDHGRTAMVVATDSVWAEFGTGMPSDTVLKTFLHYAYDNWQEPRLKDVFIIGFHDVVPSHVQEFGDTLDYLSDFFYAFPPESLNAAPLFSIGRLPWSPAQTPTLYNYFSKVQTYETADAAPWQTRVHLIADSSDDVWNFPTMMAEPIAGQVQPGYEIERDYLGQDYFPWHGDREEILANLDSGSYVVAYVGHAGLDFWSNNLHLDSSDFAPLINDSRLPIVVGMADDVAMNQFTLSGIPVSLLANASGGAIAYFATTGWAYVSASTQYKSTMFRLATSDSVAELGDLWRITAAENANWSSYTVRSVMLMGDPGLVLPPRPTAASDKPEPMPEDIRLLGNYPNPFNASTEIRYELNATVTVSLKVYDVLGREAASLVNEPQNAGIHAVQWNAQGVASGMYFAVLQAGRARQTIKMMMLK